MKNRHLYLLVLPLLVCANATLCENIYRDFLTGFHDISEHTDSTGHIIIDNTKSRLPFFETCNFNTKDKNISYSIRLRDGNHLSSKEKFLHKETSSANFGLVWNYQDNDNYTAAIIHKTAENFYDDIVHKQSLTFTIAQIKNGAKRILHEADITEMLSADSMRYNTLKLTFSDNTLTIFGGHTFLTALYSSSEIRLADNCRIGYFTDACGYLDIKRIQYQSFPIKDSLYQTEYTKESLDNAFAESNDPLEGYWTYLDRNTEDRYFKLGGKYTIAIVKNAAGNYDIVYVDGAKLYPSIWKKYMKKGVLVPTPFLFHYDLIWNDARKHTVDDESNATLNDAILSLSFPIHKSHVRFYKRQAAATGSSDNP